VVPGSDGKRGWREHGNDLSGRFVTAKDEPMRCVSCAYWPTSVAINSRVPEGYSTKLGIGQQGFFPAVLALRASSARFHNLQERCLPRGGAKAVVALLQVRATPRGSPITWINSEEPDNGLVLSGGLKEPSLYQNPARVHATPRMAVARKRTYLWQYRNGLLRGAYPEGMGTDS
jgi:hypothetical protein